MTVEKKIGFSERPPSQGLYDPVNEHDSCGIGFIANINGRKTNEIVSDGLRILDNLTHRGAVGADPTMGDGSGIVIQIPHSFYKAECEKEGIILPEYGNYAIAQIFFLMMKTCYHIVSHYLKSQW